MNIQRISRPAIRQLQRELDLSEQQARVELKNKQTQPLGIIRLDLVEESRRRLEFFRHMLRDAEEHSTERKRPLVDDEACALASKRPESIKTA
jgi:hypothetical protein